jgi:hypothetical protein
MKKIFIVNICSKCSEPTGIVDPCTELGWNDFPTTNFHGELSLEKTEELRQELIQLLINDGRYTESQYIKYNTKVLEVEFKI